MTKKLTICVAHPTPAPHTETFIRAHIERLPGTVHEVVVWPPIYNQRPIGPSSFFSRAVNKIRDHLGMRSIETKAFACFLKRRGVNVLLAEYGPTAVACLQACLFAEVPLIPHFHGYDASIKAVLKQNQEGYRQLFEYCPAIIVVSRQMIESLEQLGADRRKIHHIPCGVDEKFLKVVVAGDNPLHFIGVGRFTEKKAPYLTILAFNKLIEQYPSATLTIAGDGELLYDCRNMVRALQLQHAVNLPGRLSQTEVVNLMQGSRALVQHSICAGNGDREGTPVAILEAGAMGLPVVATRHAGIPDVVVDSETGLLVDEYDISAMADKMLALAKDEALASEMGQNAAQWVHRKYGLKDSIDALSQILLKHSNEL